MTIIESKLKAVSLSKQIEDECQSEMSCHGRYQLPQMWKARRPLATLTTQMWWTGRVAFIQHQVNTIKQLLHFLWLFTIKFLTK